MDSNCRSTSWFDETTNDRGRLLDAFLSSSNLLLINEYTDLPTFRTIRGQSYIDLTVCNYTMLPYVSDWRISDEENLSDHLYIRFNINSSNSNSNNNDFSNCFKYETRKADWDEFKNQLFTYFSIFLNYKTPSTLDIVDSNIKYKELDLLLADKLSKISDLNLFIETFSKLLTTCCDKTFKKFTSKEKVGLKSVPWWNDGLSKMRKIVNNKRRKFQRTYTNLQLRMERKSDYFSSKKVYSDMVKKAKLDSWREFCNLTNKDNPWNYVYKKAAGKLKSPVILSTLVKPDGQYTEGLSDTVEVMMDKFVARDSESDDHPYHTRVRQFVIEPPDTDDDVPFTTHEITNVISNMDHNKTPGQDGFTSNMFLCLIQIFPNFITTLFNEFLKNSTFPSCWKISKIVPLIKPGKESRKDVSKFRPISLIPIGGKILEKLLINRIMYFLYSHQFLSDNQYGFTPQRSTMDAIMAAKDFILSHLNSKEEILMISLDVEGAFDAAWWPAILKQLKEFKCPRNLYKLSQDYFRNRYGLYESNAIKSYRQYSKGCPQGSCCGPGFWTIMYDSLLKISCPANIKFIAFADDLLILISAKTSLELEMLANSTLFEVQIWARHNKICFNSQKSQQLLISRKSSPSNPSVYLNNEKIQSVSEIKYLGLIFDNKLSWNAHIEHIVGKCTQLIHQLSRSAKVYWGLGCDALKIIYTAAFLPLLLYAVPAWIDALDKQYNRKKLCRVQRLMALRIIKGYRTISFEASCIIANIVPIDLKAREYEALYNQRIIDHEEFDLDLPVPPKDWMHPASIPAISILSERNQSYYEIYTDGSKLDDRVGCAFVVYQSQEILHEQQYRLNNLCSNNQAELLAILKALEWLHQISVSFDQRKATIKTDSQVSLESIRNSKMNFELLEGIRRTVTLLNEDSWRLSFVWVKAHVGIQGNERADTLAKQAALSDFPFAFSKVPITYLKAYHRKVCYDQWQIQWSSSSNGRATREFFPTVKSRQEAQHLKLTHMITQAFSGHGADRAYLYRFHLSESADCHCGDGIEQSWDHLIFDCSNYERIRSKLIQTAITKGKPWPLDKTELISEEFYDLFSKFVNNITLR